GVLPLLGDADDAVHARQFEDAALIDDGGDALHPDDGGAGDDRLAAEPVVRVDAIDDALDLVDGRAFGHVNDHWEVRSGVMLGPIVLWPARTRDERAYVAQSGLRRAVARAAAGIPSPRGRRDQ